jgi:hypothetical protein
MKLEAVVLSGDLVHLKPLSRDHAEDLARVGLDPEIWRFSPRSPLATPEDVASYVEAASHRSEG